MTLLSLAAVACGGGGAQGGFSPPPGTIPLEPLSQDDRLYYDARGAVQDSTNLVIRDPSAWRDTWRRITASRRTAPPAPSIDFSEDMVIVVTAGAIASDQRLRVDSLAVRKEMATSGELNEILMVWYSVTGSCGARVGIQDFPVEAVKARAFHGRVRFSRSNPAPKCS